MVRIFLMHCKLKFCFLLLSLMYLHFLNGQSKHSIYLAQGANLYYYKVEHQSSLTLQNHKFENNWQTSVGYRFQYNMQRLIIHTAPELKYSKITFIQFYPQKEYTGELYNAELSIGTGYRVYKFSSIGLEYRIVHEIDATGSFFKQVFNFDTDYSALGFFMQFQLSKHFEVGINYIGTIGNQFHDGIGLSEFIHKIYLRNADFRVYYNF
jgi:hypothetical protein